MGALRVNGRLALAALLVTGCASTVQLRSQAAVGNDGPADPAITTTAGPLSPGAASSATPPTGVGAPDAASGSGTSSLSGPALSGTTTAPGPSPVAASETATAVNGVGVTPTAIYVGVAIADDAGAANSAIGAGAVTHGDETSEYRLKVADINRRGGAAGRQIRLVEFHFSATGSETAASIEQRACADFTQDHKVAMVLNTAISDNGLKCLTSKGVAVYGGSLSYSTDLKFRRFPRFLEPVALGLTRQTTNYARGLHDMGYFTRSAKIGLVTYDDPELAHAAAQLKSALAPYHQSVFDTVAVRASGVQDAAADVSSAVLKFRAEGVDHVLFIDPSAVVELLFLNQAESQQYRPRYGFGASGAGALRSTGVPQAQFVNSVSIGWFPRLDGVPAKETTYPAAESACLKLYAAGGVTFDSDNARRHADDICDSLDIAAQAFTAARGPINADSVIAATKALVARPGSGTYRLALGNGRSDGVDAVRYSVYDKPCDCFHYVGGLHAAL